MAKKPKGAFSKGRGASNLDLKPYKGENARDVFNRMRDWASDSTETQKDMHDNTSILYATARKLGIDQRSVKKEIEGIYNLNKKYGNYKESGDREMKEMQARSAANAAARKAGGLKGAAASKVSKVYKTY